MADRRPTPFQVLSKGLNRARVRGVAELGTLVADRVRDFVASDDELVVLARPAGGDPQAVEGLEFREATAADAARYASEVGTDTPTTFVTRLSGPARCFVVLLEDAFVHATWLTTGAAWTRELRGYLHPPPGEAYTYESYTRPEARGRGAYPFCLVNICARVAGEGIGRVWVAVEADNPASLKAVGRAGFEAVGTIRYRRRLGRFRLVATTGEVPKGFYLRGLEGSSP